MQYTEATVNGRIEILRNDHFVGMPVTLDFSDVATTDNGLKIVKAGTPMKSASGGYVVSNDANAEGILFADVREDRPIGTLIIHGFINKANGEASFGSSYSGSIAIPMVSIY